MLRRTALVLLAAALAACSPATDPSGGTGPESARLAQGIPSEAPYITGTVQEVFPDGRILVVSSDNQAVVDLPGSTKFFFRSGERARRSDVAVGDTVSVWITGPIRESFPVQVTADVVVIEP